MTNMRDSSVVKAEESDAKLSLLNRFLHNNPYGVDRCDMCRILSISRSQIESLFTRIENDFGILLGDDGKGGYFPIKERSCFLSQLSNKNPEFIRRTSMSQSKVILVERCPGLEDKTTYRYYVDGVEFNIEGVKAFDLKVKDLIKASNSIDVLESWLEDGHGNFTAMFRYERGREVEIPEESAVRSKEDIV